LFFAAVNERGARSECLFVSKSRTAKKKGKIKTEKWLGLSYKKSFFSIEIYYI